ncbi:MAG: Site-specific recombinase, partial [Streptomyces oryziradicis]|nr:Site-specific recombinase [Actinacidiphila oryziradicis]
NLACAPEQLLGKLFEITQLTVQLHANSDDATLTVTLPADYLTKIADAAERINKTMPNHTRVPATRNRATGTVVDAVRAPGRIRTCDTGFRRAVLYPLSY